MPVITRASTHAQLTRLIGDINTTQTRLFDAQNQLSSGLKTDSFSGFNGQVEQFVFLEAKIKTAVAYQENNAVNISRLETMKESLQQITNMADEMEDLLVLRRNPAIAQDISFGQQMRAKILAVAGELNTSFEGKYMFSGTRTNVPPVITEPSVPAPVENGVPDDGYYQGSKSDVTMRADDNVELDARVRADAEAFQKIFAAAHMSLEADAQDDDEMLQQSIDMLQEGLDGVIALESSINADILTITNITERQNSLELYWKGVTEELSKTDILSVSTQLSVDQTVLQASFQAFASINSLRLVDFLN